MLGLLLWHGETGDIEALGCVRKIGDLLCATFLDTGRSVFDHSRPEVNGATMHALALLHQRAGVARYLALALQIEKQLGSPSAGDHLRTALSGLPFHHTEPRWETLHTIQAFAPLYEIKIASTNDLTTVHSRPGGAELNCCAVNAPRALGLLSEWAVFEDQGKLVLNYYGPGTIETTVPSGGAICLRQETEYPLEDTVVITVELEQTESFVLALRIPYRSECTRVSVNGESVPGVVPGSYLQLERTWERGDQVTIHFDFRFHFWVHEEATAPYAQEAFWAGRRLEEEDQWFMMPEECEPSADASAQASEPCPLASIYRGPLLLVYDPRFNRALDGAPTLNATSLEAERATSGSWIKPWLLLECATADGTTVRLCDFASAGNTGLPYRSWLAVNSPEVEPAAFSRENPLRSFRCP